ncbi:MAG TPA: DNA mismatch endonuclease Vsr [Sphingobium sp.]|uniref:very short patch repair endonuclease n=1 Tax=Sphingobium sp. TaxID=1912891 RepID=UPI002ED6A8EC
MMVDTISEERRSWNMSRIRGKDTKPEMILRSLLHKAGFRFRLHNKGLPGKPDIVLPRYRTVIFVHGCFWHRHEGCRNTTTPSTRMEFWQNKFESNVDRDRRNVASLEQLGWRVETVWECDLKKDAAGIVKGLSEAFRGAH